MQLAGHRKQHCRQPVLRPVLCRPPQPLAPLAAGGLWRGHCGECGGAGGVLFVGNTNPCG